MLIVAVILVADLSIVRPRPKPEIPPTSENAPAEPVILIPIIRQPVIVLRPTLPPSPADMQAERLKVLETELKEKRVQAVRIEQKLDEFLRAEEAKDAGGER